VGVGAGAGALSGADADSAGGAAASGASVDAATEAADALGDGSPSALAEAPTTVQTAMMRRATRWRQR
jgi:hypothetical protein